MLLFFSNIETRFEELKSDTLLRFTESLIKILLIIFVTFRIIRLHIESVCEYCTVIF